jgi:hypothetical protein
MPKIKYEITDINWITSWEYSCLNSECPICRIELESAKSEIQISTCGHGYHKVCIEQWFKQLSLQQKKCPICSMDYIIKNIPYNDINKNKKFKDVIAPPNSIPSPITVPGSTEAYDITSL